MNLRSCYNREFIAELTEATGRNIILLMVDGSLIFGSIGRIEHAELHIIAPVAIASLGQAVFRPGAMVPPLQDVLATEIIVECEDIGQVIFGLFTTAVFSIGSNPIIKDIFCPSIPDPDIHECKIEHLVDKLDELEGRNLVISTLGGWNTGGQLCDLPDCVAWISEGTAVFPPYIVPGSLVIGAGTLPPLITLTGPFSAMINMVALTGITLSGN